MLTGKEHACGCPSLDLPLPYLISVTLKMSC